MAQLLIPRELRNRDLSTSKLTEVAKRVAIPGSIVGTDWGPVSNTCQNEMAIEFDGWQDGLGQLMLARSTDEALIDGGMLAHTVGGFHLSAMRQIGKSYFFAGSLFGLCQHYPGILIIWSAHHSTTHEETFGAMQGFALRRQIVPFIQKVYTGSGDEEVRFWNGSRILFGARERGFGRGIPGVDVLVCDEGQIMSERARQNMIATMNTSWLGLHIYAGTPPTPEDKSEGWMRKYDEAWLIEDPEIVRVETDDMAWIEFGADDDADLDDVYQWAKNPSVPHRTPFHAMQRLRSNLNDDGFRREGLGLYDKDGGSIFDVARWNTLGVEDAQQPNRVALVLDVGPDRKWAAIAVAGDLVTGGAQDLDELENEEQRSLVMVISLQKGAVAKIVELNESRDLIDIAITPGAARALETELVKANLEYEILTGAEVSASYGNLQESIKTGLVAHVDQPELNYALLNSKSRYLQTGEAESFDRRGYSVDVSPAVAAACALYRWGLLDTPMPFVM